LERKTIVFGFPLFDPSSTLAVSKTIELPKTDVYGTKNNFVRKQPVTSTDIFH